MIVRPAWLWIVAIACALAARVAAAEPAGDGVADEGPNAAVFDEQVRPFVAQYCMHCHGADEVNAEVRFDHFNSAEAALAERETWEKVIDRLARDEMPPPDELQPSEEEKAAVIAWVERELERLDRNIRFDPGRVTARRLNRAEYANTIRDLLGIRFEAAEDFPADDVGYGFDNIGDVLSLPPLLMEKYLAAAETIAAEAVAADHQRPADERRLFVADVDDDNRDEAARTILANVARRAYRRPVTEDEVERLAGLAAVVEEDGGSFERAIEVALTAVLISPHFLFRIERDDAEGPHRINDHELASRLSYFLFSSMPDEELLAAAEAGDLQDAEVLQAQVRRMLADEKSLALVENFAGQWLQLRNLATFSPDPELFAGFDETLREAMRRETELFFAAVMAEDRSVLELLDADFTFLNERLAQHYGIDGIQGDEFRRVELSDRRRGGLVTQASILTVTSNPTRTSPVKRGKWILENLLGDPPPDPPPGVEDLAEDEQAALSGSLRQRMEQHRENASCALCHARMDPLGFGLENYDAIGAWRTEDAGFEIDPSGELPSGESFAGPAELKEILVARQLDFCRCLAEKMLTYALGRGLERYDRPAIDEIVKRLVAEEFRFSALVLAIVQTAPFQMRRGEGGES